MSVELLLFHVKANRLPPPETEFRFHPVRRWRADLAWPAQKLLVEFEGGIYTQGRHTRGKGYEGDLEKYNAATLHGFRVLRFSTKHVKSGVAVQQIAEALHAG